MGGALFKEHGGLGIVVGSCWAKCHGLGMN